MKKSQTSFTGMESPSRWSTFLSMAWLKRLFTTKQAKRKDLLEVFAAQNDRVIKLLEKQQATIDRVIQAKFDTPIVGRATEQTVSQPMFPQTMMSDALSLESDEDFIATMEKLHKDA